MAKRPKLYEAKVKDDYRIPSITAFGGWEYVKHEWRPVPDEVDAAVHTHLDVREVGVTEAEEVEEAAGAEMTEVEASDETATADNDLPPRLRAGKDKAEEGNVPKSGRAANKRRSGRG